MYKCPNCGGEMEFLPENGIIKCEFCGSEFSPEQDLNKTRKNAVEHKLPEGRVFTCSQCGASLYTLEDTGVTFCSFCGSQAFLESRMRGDEDIIPDLIIPFKISKEQCQQLYKDKIKGAWFLPAKMKKDTTIDKFRGIYMPCWIYTGETWAEGDYTSVKTTRSGAYDIIESYKVKANAHGTYGGFVEDASSSFPDGIMRELSPFSMKMSKPFKDTYMTGFYADIGNVPPEVYHDEIYSFLDANVKNDLAADKTIRSKNISRTELNMGTSVKAKISDTRKGFLPVWFLSNRNERTGLMSYAVINGLNGKIHADLPVDMKKYLLLSLLIAIPIFLVLQFFTMKPGTLLVITMLLLGIMMFFSTRMIREAYIQEHGLDDEGLIYLNPGKGPRKNPPGKPGTPPPRRAKAKSGKALRMVFGILCFIGFPFLSAIATYILNVNLLYFGFLIGIVMFLLVASGALSPAREIIKSQSFEPGKKKIRMPVFMVLRSIMLPLIGVAAGLIVTIASPAHDLYYYGTAVLCCILLILTVLDFARSTSRLAYRKPAQLGKRGGDEDDE